MDFTRTYCHDARLYLWNFCFPHTSSEIALRDQQEIGEAAPEVLIFLASNMVASNEQVLLTY